MSWDQYTSSGRKKTLSGRGPIIGIALVAVLIFGGIAYFANSARGGGATIGPAEESAMTSTTRPGFTEPTVAPNAPGPEKQMHPDATPEQMATARKAAENFVAKWARPDMPEAQWFAELKPLLVNGADEGFRYTEPSNIPATRITGDSQVVSASALDAIVMVPTDAGVVAVQVDMANDPAQISQIDMTTPRRQ